MLDFLTSTRTLKATKNVIKNSIPQEIAQYSFINLSVIKQVDKTPQNYKASGFVKKRGDERAV